MFPHTQPRRPRRARGGTAASATSASPAGASASTSATPGAACCSAPPTTTRRAASSLRDPRGARSTCWARVREASGPYLRRPAARPGGAPLRRGRGGDAPGPRRPVERDGLTAPSRARRRGHGPAGGRRRRPRQVRRGRDPRAGRARATRPRRSSTRGAGEKRACCWRGRRWRRSARSVVGRRGPGSGAAGR